MVGGLRDAAEHVHDEAAEGVEAVFLLARQVLVDFQLRLQALDADVTVDQPGTVLAADDVAVFRRFRLDQFADGSAEARLSAADSISA